MDARNRELIKLGEAAMARQMTVIARVLDEEELRIIDKAEQKAKGIWSYRQIINGVFVVIAAAGCMGLVFSLSILPCAPWNASASC